MVTTEVDRCRRGWFVYYESRARSVPKQALREIGEWRRWSLLLHKAYQICAVAVYHTALKDFQGYG